MMESSHLADDTAATSGQVRIMLWATPQSTSTILAKCLTSAVKESEMYFEPYTFGSQALNIAKSINSGNGNNQGRTERVETNEKKDSRMEIGDKTLERVAETMSSEDCSNGRVDTALLRLPRIKKLLDNPDGSKQMILCKDFGHSVHGHYEYLPDRAANYRHVFLIRHPAKVFRSRRKVAYADHKFRVDAGRTGSEKLKTPDDFHLVRDSPPWYNPAGLLYKELYDLLLYVKEHLDPNPLVLDSDDLLSDPPSVLRKYYGAVGLPYSDDTIARWNSDAAATDAWRCAFSPIRSFEFIDMYCRTAIGSSQFLPPKPAPSDDDLTTDVRECVEYCMPFYEKMHKTRLS